MEKYILDDRLFDPSNDEIYQEYLDLLVMRETKMAIELDTDINDSTRHEYGRYVNDNIRAFKYLFYKHDINDPMSEELIINTANRVNASNDWISNGYRKNNGINHDTGDVIPDADQISNVITSLIQDYEENNDEDLFYNEAKLHIGIVMTQAFEDGNHRTANLITNYNLIQKHIAPIIITHEYLEAYHKAVYGRDIDTLAEIFKKLSILESDLVTDLLNHYIEYKDSWSKSK